MSPPVGPIGEMLKAAVAPRGKELRRRPGLSAKEWSDEYKNIVRYSGGREETTEVPSVEQQDYGTMEREAQNQIRVANWRRLRRRRPIPFTAVSFAQKKRVQPQSITLFLDPTRSCAFQIARECTRECNSSSTLRVSEFLKSSTPGELEKSQCDYIDRPLISLEDEYTPTVRLVLLGVQTKQGAHPSATSRDILAQTFAESLLRIRCHTLKIVWTPPGPTDAFVDEAVLALFEQDQLIVSYRFPRDQASALSLSTSLEIGSTKWCANVKCPLRYASLKLPSSKVWEDRLVSQVPTVCLSPLQLLSMPVVPGVSRSWRLGELCVELVDSVDGKGLEFGRASSTGSCASLDTGILQNRPGPTTAEPGAKFFRILFTNLPNLKPESLDMKAKDNLARINFSAGTKMNSPRMGIRWDADRNRVELFSKLGADGAGGASFGSFMVPRGMKTFLVEIVVWYPSEMDRCCRGVRDPSASRSSTNAADVNDDEKKKEEEIEEEEVEEEEVEEEEVEEEEIEEEEIEEEEIEEEEIEEEIEEENEGDNLKGKFVEDEGEKEQEKNLKEEGKEKDNGVLGKEKEEKKRESEGECIGTSIKGGMYATQNTSELTLIGQETPQTPHSPNRHGLNDRASKESVGDSVKGKRRDSDAIQDVLTRTALELEFYSTQTSSEATMVPPKKHEVLLKESEVTDERDVGGSGGAMVDWKTPVLQDSKCPTTATDNSVAGVDADENEETAIGREVVAAFKNGKRDKMGPPDCTITNLANPSLDERSLAHRQPLVDCTIVSADGRCNSKCKTKSAEEECMSRLSGGAGANVRLLESENQASSCDTSGARVQENSLKRWIERFRRRKKNP